MNDKLEKANSQGLEKISEKDLTSFLDVMGLATKLNEKEKIQYLHIANAYGLNPFKKEIHVSKYGDTLSIVVGYETYIKRAERSGQLNGWNVITEGKAEDNSLKAIITIYRKDRGMPFVHEVYYSEYVQKTNQGFINKFWQKPITMIKKVAMSQGFRLCFADELGGMPYSNEETGVVTEEATHTVLDEKQKCTPGQLQNIIERIKANEPGIIEAAKNHFDFDEKQLKEIEDASKDSIAAINNKIKEETAAASTAKTPAKAKPVEQATPAPKSADEDMV